MYKRQSLFNGVQKQVNTTTRDQKLITTDDSCVDADGYRFERVTLHTVYGPIDQTFAFHIPVNCCRGLAGRTAVGLV